MTLCIIQARLNSTRLPHKILEDIGGFPALWHVIMRARHALPHADVVVAVPARDERVISGICDGEYFAFDGRESDVLARYYAVAKLRHATTVIRLTADCPFVGIAGIEAVTKAVESGHEYAWTGTQVNGLDAEAFTFDILNRAHLYAHRKELREHVTPWIRQNAESIYRYTGYDHLPRYRWTLDDVDDLAWFRDVAKLTDVSPPDPSPEKLHSVIQNHPELHRLDHAA